MADNGNEDEDSELEEEQKDPDESLRGLNSESCPADEKGNASSSKSDPQEQDSKLLNKTHNLQNQQRSKKSKQ
jgi:hypothetical protein